VIDSDRSRPFHEHVRLIATGHVLKDPGVLDNIAAHQDQLAMGALLVLVMGLALAMVPLMMFPILERQSETLALGYVGFRGALGAVAHVLVAVCWLLLVAEGHEYAHAGAAAASQFQGLGTVLLKADDLITPILNIVFSLGAPMLYELLHRTRLTPPWMSGWGFIAAVMCLAVGVLAMFDTSLEVLLLPMAVQEMVMAVWLIARGFDPASVASLSGRQPVAG